MRALQLTCPTHTGWRWFLCAHEELAHPVIGQLLMATGVVITFIGLWEILHG